MGLATMMILGVVASEDGGGSAPSGAGAISLSVALAGVSSASPTPPSNITINNSNILDNAMAGTVVGTLTMVGGTLPTTFNLVSPSTFAISGADLVRSASGTITPGTTNVVVNCTDANGQHVPSN